MMLLSYTLSICLVLCQFFYCTANYGFEPASRHIQVKLEESFEFGFDKADNVTMCYYSNEKFSGSFELNSTLGKENDDDSLEKLNNCGLRIKNANENTPLQWQITIENSSGENQTESVSVTIIYNNMTIFLEEISVVLGSSFYNYLEPPNDRKIKDCSIILEDNTIIILRKDNENIQVKNDLPVVNLNDSKCGFKFDKVAEDDTNEIKFQVVDENELYYEVVSKISKIDPRTEIENLSYRKYLGDNLLLQCGGLSDKQQFCHLYNPQEKLVLVNTTCFYNIPILTADKFGVWKCLVGYEHSMETIQFSAEVIQNDNLHPVKVTTWSEQQQENSFYSLGCKISEYVPGAATYCKFTRPDKKVLKSEPGLASDRYLSLSTKLKSSVCGLEITQPLETYEKGTWKCEIGLDNLQVGAFLFIENKKPIDFNVVQRIDVRDGASFTLKCMTWYSSDYCYFISPTGKHYLPDNPMLTTLGECSYKIEKATLGDEGEWSCFFAGENQLADEEFNIQVSLIQSDIQTADQEAGLGQSVQLLCNTEIPLHFCRFVTPDGLVYTLQTTQISDSDISYVGRGLEYGDCGIQIKKVQASDEGMWFCYAYDGSEEISANVTLKILNPDNDKPSIAASVGMSVGIVILVIIMFALIFYRNKRCNLSNNNSQQ